MITFKDNALLNQNELNNLYSSVGWLAYTKDLATLEKAVNHSLAVITAWHNDHLIGLIRAIGDGYTILYIQDLLVHPDFQNNHIGSHLMNRLLSDYSFVRQKVLLTEDAPDVRHFYEKFGFESCDKGMAVAFYKEF